MTMLFSLFNFVGLGALTMFVLMRFEGFSSPPCQRDITLLTHFFEWRASGWNCFFYLISAIGSIFILIPLSLLIIIYMFKLGLYNQARVLALSLNGVCIIANSAKHVFKRKRPALFPSIGKRPADYSYPSAHSAQIVAFILSLIPFLSVIFPEDKVIIMIVAGLTIIGVAISRVYMQIHYPSDVVAGLLLGGLWHLCCVQLIGLASVLQF